MVFFLGFSAILVGACDRSEADREPQPNPTGPNVLLITLDTTRADRLGCYGHNGAQTPTLDALAASGVRFEQALAQVPLTLPSHVSLLSGTYPVTNGIHINAGGVLGPELPALAEEFKQRGYKTAAIIAAWVLDSSFGLARGFDHYDDRIGGGRDSSRHVRERRANEVSDAALSWLEQYRDQPFFAWVHYFDPHYPYNPPESYRGKCPDPYDGEIAFVDAEIRRLVEWLEASQLRERTMIVVAGDHGEAFGEHGEPQHGLFVYDTTLHVPLIFSYPKGLPAGREVTGVVRLVDVMPTILDVLGWSRPAALEGTSLAQACQTGEQEPLAAYGETEYPRLSFGWAALHCLTTQRWKYIRAPQPELYDRVSDPQELSNVIAAHPELAADMRAQLGEIVSTMSPRQAPAVALDAEALANLESLGYVGTAAAADDTGTEGARRDPKDMIEVYREYREVKRLASQRKYAEVVARLEPLVKLSPESDELHGVLGEAYLRLGRPADAQREYEASLRTLSRSASHWCGLGDALRAQRKMGEALDCYKKAIEVSPSCGQAFSRLGLVYAEHKDFRQAEEHYRRHVELNPRSPVALTNLANILPELGRTDEAVELLRTSLQHDPRYEAAHRALWVTLRYASRWREAIDALHAALAVLPNDRSLMFELAWLLASAPDARLRDGAEALRLAKICHDASPDDPRNLDVLAAAYAELGDFAQAISTARRALSLAEQSQQPAMAQHIAARLTSYSAARPYRLR